MRSRTRSIRFKIFALLGVPVVALIVLWGAVAAVTGEDALEQRDFDLLNDRLGGPAQNLVTELGQERLRTATFLGADTAGAAAERGELNTQRARTDAAAAAFRAQVLAPATRGAFPEPTRRYADEVIRRLDGLAALRSAVDPRPGDRLASITGYNVVLDSLFRFSGELSARGDVSLDHGAQAIITAHRGIDAIGRESALVAAAGTAGRLTEAERRMFVAEVTTRRFLMEEARTRLAEAGFRDLYEPVFVSPAYVTLTSMEDRIIDAAGGARLPVGLSAWQPTAEALGTAFDGAAQRARTSLAARSGQISEESLLRLGVAGGLGLLMLVASILFSVRFGRRLTRELVGLQEAARDLAEVRLPEVVDRLRQRTDVEVSAETPQLAVGRSREVVNVAKSFAAVQRTAIEAAVGQAELRKGISQVFVNLARRNQSLLHRQLAMLDTLESRAEPDVLEDLFRLDHLTTRMRRHSESLIILSGASSGRGWREPVGIVDVLRGAVAEVEDYMRVAVLTSARDAVVGSAVADVIHLVAELVENATSFSPPTTEVHLMAEMVGNGLAVEIEDRGLGMSQAMLDQMNEQLRNPPEFDLADTDQLGLFVVARLAERHAINVSLRRSPYGGTTAIVLLPHGIVVPASELESDDAAPAPAAPAEAPSSRYATQLRQDRAAAASKTDEGLPRRVAARKTERQPAPAARPPKAATPEPAPWPAVPGAPAAGTPERPAPPAPAPWPGTVAAPRTPERADAASTPDTPGPGAAGGGSETHAGLPRRVRQESLAPQLRGERPAPPDTPEPSSRSPEDTGALIASMQAGWRRGRAEAEIHEPVDDEGSR